jgi:mannan endo-1,4-beta-mannosidase
MGKKLLAVAVLTLVVTAAVFVFRGSSRAADPALKGFVQTRGGRFEIDGHPFRFVGANVAVMYRDEDRTRMPETLRQAAQTGIKVVRVWASGEGGPNDVKPIADFADWPRNHPFRWAPGQWNEEAFVYLDRVLAEAAHNNLRVQLCLANWWRDTGGVTQYLRWAGINNADDERFPFGINNERAMLFYTNEETRRLYREHLEKIATRRNTVTGALYRDDPTIFGYELINEAQVITGQWSERRGWMAEMSTYLKSLDPKHLIASGDWGYRSAAERREWLQDHALQHIDFCDVHNYPRDDLDTFVDSPTDLREFIDNRAAAAFSLRKPLVFGEFGIRAHGHKGFSQIEWFRAFFDSNAQAGTAGAIFWILTPDPNRGYGITYASQRDQSVIAEINRASQIFASLQGADPPLHLTDAERHLVPRQFAFTRDENDSGTYPKKILREDGTILYRFKPKMVDEARFEKLGNGPGYIWGSGVGFVEYLVPERQDRRRVSYLLVRAHIQPVLPVSAKASLIKTRVTLLVNGSNCGSRLIPFEDSNQPLIQEWRADGLFVRLAAWRGLPLTIRFAVQPDADWPYGVNISNWPEGYDPHDAKPVEVEVR